MKECEYCGNNNPPELTSDHVVPRWLVQMTRSLGFRPSNKQNRQILCTTCNGLKGGTIDWSHQKVRDFMYELARFIDKKLQEPRQ